MQYYINTMKRTYKNKVKIIYIILIFSYLLSDPPVFEIITNNNPYPSKLFFSTSDMDPLESNHDFMTILDESLDNYWQINSNQNGRDFRKNYDKISYFHYNREYTGDSNENYWIIADKSMQELDTLKYAFENGFLDWHDMRIIDGIRYLNEIRLM